MYDLLEQPVKSLDRSGRFLIWAMRGWAHAIERRMCPPMALHRGFVEHGLGAMLPHFHVAMILLNKEAKQKITLAPLKHERIVDDEAVLLTVWRDIGLARTNLVRTTIEHLVADEMVYAVSRSLTACSAAMTMAGFELSELTAQPVGD